MQICPQIEKKKSVSSEWWCDLAHGVASHHHSNLAWPALHHDGRETGPNVSSIATCAPDHSHQYLLLQEMASVSNFRRVFTAVIPKHRLVPLVIWIWIPSSF